MLYVDCPNQAPPLLIESATFKDLLLLICLSPNSLAYVVLPKNGDAPIE